MLMCFCIDNMWRAEDCRLFGLGVLEDMQELIFFNKKLDYLLLISFL